METVPAIRPEDIGAISEFIYYLFLLVYIIFSIILVYHWQSYATDAHVTRRTLTAYFISTLLLLAVAGSTLFAL
jgi:hypothetical protein